MRFTLAAVLFGLTSRAARITLPRVITSNMVLQAETPSIFGWTDGTAYKQVSASFTDPATNVTITATSRPSDSGKEPLPTVPANATAWTIDLPPQRASMQPVDILLSSEGASDVALSNVLFGDVYVCSGQSNMEFSVAEMFDSERTIDSAGIPGIRLFATQKNASEVRLNDLVDTQYPEGWVESSTTNVCGSEYSDNRTAFCGPHCGPSAVVKTFRRNTWGYFSAVCFVHGLQMLRATGRPQGLLESCWGGTRIETWSSKEAMATCGAAKPQDGSHFTGMIAPLVRLPIRGAIWYQGEANAKQGNDYDCQLRSMIKDWRARWHRSQNFTFGVAQLAPAGDSSGGVLRWSQRSVATSLPGAYMSVATDLYDKDSPCGAVHIRNKTAVGRRLALGTLAAQGGGGFWSGPVPHGVSVTAQAPNAAIKVEFNGCKLPLRLESVSGMTVSGATHANFEVTWTQRPENVTEKWTGWVPADAVAIQGSTLSVTVASGGDSVQGIRYLWGDVPSTESSIARLNGQQLYDDAGLPAGVFVAACDGDKCALLDGGNVNPMT